MSAARVAGLWVVMLLAGVPAARAATVAVAPIRDAGKRGQGAALERQIEKGLAGGHIRVVSPSALASGARKLSLPPGDIDKRPVLMPVAKAAGADAVFTASIVARGRQLEVRVFSLEGVELWSRKIPLSRGKLAPAIPGKIARAVSAAIANAPAPADDMGNADQGTSDQGSADEGSSDQGSSDQGDQSQASDQGSSDQGSSDQTPPAHTKSKSGSSDDDTAIVTPKHKPHRAADSDTSSSSSSSDDTGDEAMGGPPKDVKPDTQPAPPIIDVGVGFAVLSRTYRVCPGPVGCSDPNPPPATGTLDLPVNYQTSSPAGGFVLRLELFPMPKLVRINDGLTLTLGVTAEYLRSLSVTNQYPKADGTTGTFTSNSSRLTANVAGRLYFNALDGTGYVGLHGGALLPSFSADVAAEGTTPVLYPSERKGFDVGLRAQIPLAANLVKVMGQAELAPAANPGVTETTAYGQTGTGKGLLFRGGLEGEYSFVGYGAYADYAQFSDVFAGPGDRTTNGAATDEKYLTFFLMIRGRY